MARPRMSSLTKRRLRSRSDAGQWLALATRRVRLAAKDVYQRVRFAPSTGKPVLFIVGCQRSGTTLMTRVFERDYRCKVYPEVSRLSSQDVPKHLRLDPLPEVEEALAGDRARFIVLKPLVESQNTLHLLDYFDGRAIWMHRHYRSVAASIVNKWGPDHPATDLGAIVEQQPGNWRYEGVSDEVRDVVLEYYAPDMDGYTAAALYWYVRNTHAIDLDLASDPRVIFCRYEDLATGPAHQIERVYDLLGVSAPDRSIAGKVDQRGLAPLPDFRLPGDLEDSCEALLETLTSLSGSVLDG